MRLGSRRFAPRWWATTLYLVVALVMLALGRWQLVRADEKIALLESAERARAAPAVALGRVDDVERAADAHRRVVLAGRWEGERQLLWDNRAHAGRAGYEVITPFRLDGGRLALVNRGWTAPGPTRDVLPDVSLPDASRPGDVVLEGLLSRPSKGFASGDALAASGSWPRVLQYLDYPAIEAALGEPIVAAVVQAQVAEEDGAFAAARRGAEPAGAGDGTGGGGGSDPTARESTGGAADASAESALLIPNWRPAASGPEKHYGYAFQWFAMATALTAIFVVVNLSRSESDEPEPPRVE